MVSISFLMVLDVGLILIYLFLTVTCASVADYTHCTTQIHMAGQDAELGKLVSTTSQGSFYQEQKKNFLALM